MSHGQKAILIAEDDPADQLLLKRAFGQAGIDNPLVFFGDGAEAIDYFSSRPPQECNVALLLLDLKMPKVNGFEVLSWLKAHEKLRRVPVVVLTSSDLPEDVEKAYAAGANSYLRKPSNSDELTQIAVVLRVYWLMKNELPQLSG